MIVRDTGAAWHVVLQPEHAELSEEVARAWADRGPRHDSVVLAARRHDDGWATWERSPRVDDDGKPVVVPRRPRPCAPRLLPRRDRSDHRRGPVRRACSSRCTARGSTGSATAPTRAWRSRARRRCRRWSTRSSTSRRARYPSRMADGRRRRRAPPRGLPPAAVVRPLLARLLPPRVGRARRGVRGRDVPLRAGRPLADTGRALAVRRERDRVLARPPTRAQARLGPGRVPRGVLRAARRAHGDRVRGVERGGRRASHVAPRPCGRRACPPRCGSSGSPRSRSSASSRTCSGCTPCGRHACSPGTPGTTRR